LLVSGYAAMDYFVFFHGVFPLVVCHATLYRIVMQIKVGTIIFATLDCKEGLADARAWLVERKLTPDQVRLYRLDGQVLVETLKLI
jgi:hypothetical protein